MPLGREVGLGPSDILLDGDPAPVPKKEAQPSNFRPCLLLPNGWTDQDATWYEGRPRCRPHCVTWGPSSPHPKRVTATSPNFWPMSIVAERSSILVTAEHLFAIIHTTRMWANARRDRCPAEYRLRPLFNAAVWLTPTTRVPCVRCQDSKPVEITGGAPNYETISAASGPQFTILWAHVEKILLLNKFFSDCRYMP